MRDLKIKMLYLHMCTVSEAEVQVQNNSHYGKPRKPVHMSNVYCNGSEQQILSCKYYEFSSLDWKKMALNLVEVAGVSCHSHSQLGNSTESSTLESQTNDSEDGEQTDDSDMNGKTSSDMLLLNTQPPREPMNPTTTQTYPVLC